MDRNQSPGSHSLWINWGSFFLFFFFSRNALAVVSSFSGRDHAALGNQPLQQWDQNWDLEGSWEGGAAGTFEVSPWECICVICALYIGLDSAHSVY